MLKKTSLIIIVAVLVIISSAIFYQSGKKAGKDESAKQVETLQKSLESFFPPLPETIISATGKIAKVEADGIYFEASFRIERFPQADGSETQTLTKKAKIGPETKIVKSDFARLPLEEIAGVPEVELELKDLQIGQQVFISTEENLAKKDEFIATKIQLLGTF